jgi:two-component system NarL family response regulator
MTEPVSAHPMADNVPQIRIAIIDDHPAVLLGLSNMLSTHADMEVVAALSSAMQLNKLEIKGEVDVLLIDLRMPDIGGIEATAIARVRFPRAQILIISSYETDEEIFRVIKAGASGYIIKNAPEEEIIHAIHRVKAGKRYLNQHLAKKLSERLERDALTAREVEIVHHVARGLTNKQIGDQLSISEHTVRNHVNSIISKMQAQDRTEAAVQALKRGIIQLDSI